MRSVVVYELEIETYSQYSNNFNLSPNNTIIDMKRHCNDLTLYETSGKNSESSFI